jgi:hypothetical protein
MHQSKWQSLSKMPHNHNPHAAHPAEAYNLTYLSNLLLERLESLYHRVTHLSNNASNTDPPTSEPQMSEVERSKAAMHQISHLLRNPSCVFDTAATAQQLVGRLRFYYKYPHALPEKEKWADREMEREENREGYTVLVAFDGDIFQRPSKRPRWRSEDDGSVSPKSFFPEPAGRWDSGVDFDEDMRSLEDWYSDAADAVDGMDLVQLDQKLKALQGREAGYGRLDLVQLDEKLRRLAASRRHGGGGGGGLKAPPLDFRDIATSHHFEQKAKPIWDADDGAARVWQEGLGVRVVDNECDDVRFGDQGWEFRRVGRRGGVIGF